MKYIKLLRVKQYIKNFIVFLPLLFAKELFSSELSNVIFGFIAFCFISSVVYIINDIKDVSYDKKHDTKKNRPIAKGDISVLKATIIMIVCFLLSILFNYFSAGLCLYSWLLLFFYLVLNVFYSFIGKNIILLDLLLLVVFYIIRLYYGSIIIDVSVSNWLFLTTMSLSFFFAFGKRRNELLQYKSKSRLVLQNYNKDFLDKFMYSSVTLSIVFYSLWVVEQNIKYLFFSIPFLFVILMKYCLDVESDLDGDPTEVFFRDKVLIGLTFLFCIFFVIIMR